MQPSLTTAALIGLAALVASCGPANPPSAETPVAPAPPPVPAVPPDVQAALAAMPAPYNEANYLNGRRIFGQCSACHQIKAAAGNSVGPNLHGVIGRQAGSKEGFIYSPAVKNAGFVWDEAKIDHWLTNPQSFLAGNKMAFAGVKKPEDRRDVIAYIKIEGAK